MPAAALYLMARPPLLSKNGKDTAVFDADILLKGVAIPTDVHDVRFVFDPFSFKIGALLTAVSLVIIVALSL